jgi:uncharacterized protein YyaL (SSP411 family)
LSSSLSPNKSNALSNEASAYLQQHAQNPVDWRPWGKAALEMAQEANKLIIVSIGYSSCHWCHVMERESFESEDVAEVMNENFISIKVDREERPEVDKMYMDAVHLMQQQGGWPLNCIALPDSTPVFGGTYFKHDDWIRILKQLNELWENEPEKVKEYAQKVKSALNSEGLIPVSEKSPKEQDINVLTAAVKRYLQHIDKVHGGGNRAPKFPMPVLYQFLLHFGHHFHNVGALSHVQLTLQKMTRGGLFDHIGGGFARYSTDKEWKVPHFEKMLYDNAQLLGLYSEAYGNFQDAEYADTCSRIISWLKREMKDEKGGFYSAQDADSDGVEGKYHTWSIEELQTKLPDNFSEFYHTDPSALWEGRIINIRKNPETHINNPELEALNEKLLEIRNEKNPPFTDKKILCSWNALLGSAFVKHYRFIGDKDSLKEAIELHNFIKSTFLDEANMRLQHSTHAASGEKSGFLEDYAFFIEMELALFEATADKNYLDLAQSLTEAAIEQYFDAEKGLFYISAKTEELLISRPMELADNVVPSSNSTMALNLNKIGTLLGNEVYTGMAENMLSRLEGRTLDYVDGYAQWADLFLTKAIGSPEIVICGDDWKKRLKALVGNYLPNVLLVASDGSNPIEIFSDRYIANQTKTYICQSKTCGLPIDTLDDTKTEIQKLKRKIESI